MEKIKKQIELAWENRELLKEKETIDAIRESISLLDKGAIRVADKINGKWIVNDWIKKAVILFFPISEMEVSKIGPFEFYDKIPLKNNYKEANIRVVPHAIARYGAYIASGVIMMPSYINIGAYVDSGTMIDTWATVGSCAQIGKNVHISGGVGIGGCWNLCKHRLWIIENSCFIGSRCIIVEGAHVAEEAVLGANTVITGSSKIIDISGEEKIEYKGYVPPRSVVIPGSYTKKFPGGDFNVNCALIIGKRKESTDRKTSLNNALRTFDVEV